ncbi:MAG: LacI family DNA-binding transcriptional regulator [Lentisphaeria bacterium]|nr:LacI family DNA-binding transcriptional regulator [Lentisphaeria bacterium]
MAPTIRDVALKAGVSFQLAAAVLGGKTYARAAEPTRRKIFSAARELGYVPNVSARILRGNASKIIGVLIDSRAPESMYRNLAEVEQAADRLGYRILTAQAHDNPEKLLDAYRSLRQNGVDGIVSFAHDYSQLNCHLDARLKDDPKIVFVFNAGQPGCSSVDVDIVGAMTSAVAHLRANGYRKPALVLEERSDRRTLSRQRRIDGFTRACPEGMILYPERGNGADGLAAGCRNLVREVLIPRQFDAVIAQNDNLAAVLMKQLLSAGIRIPQDFGLIGWDNLLIGECLPVTLTSLYCDEKKVASSILKILLEKIAGDPEPVRVEFPMELVIRESSSRDLKI